MLAEFLLVFVAGVATVIVYLIMYARKNYGELEKLGIPVVKPHFILGSSPNFYKEYSHLEDMERFKTYGDVFGAYEGLVPYVYVCDPDIVRQVMIKDFDYFRNHSFHDMFAKEHMLSNMIDFLNDDTWKAVRSLLSPTFTSAKLKRMSLRMKEVSEEFVKQTKEELKKSNNGIVANVNIYDEVFALLTDLVARITLNIKIDNPKDPNNDFAKGIKAFFSAQPPAFVYPYTQSFPFLNNLFVHSAYDKEANFFGVIFRKVMSERKQSGERQDDFVDFLNDFHDKTQSDPELKKLGVTEATVIANAVEFYLAGQDSMSQSFSMVAYYLTCNPDIEKKLYEEIDEYTQKYNGKIDHSTLGDLPYLNACLNEALRLHPVFHKLERLCNKDWEYKGIKIKKGMTFCLPLWPYHRNPKYFSDPEKFDPERFMPYNKDKMNQTAFGTFGHGPRMCIGMRFSLECLIMFSAYVFQNFQFKARPNTEVTYVPGLPFQAMIGPMNLDIVSRDKPM